MSVELPLAAAQRRLGRPGRPKKATPDFGHDAGITPSQARVRTGGERPPLVSQATALLPPRLLDLVAAASYLGGVSVWTVRDLLANGLLRRVRLPAPDGRELRRVLLDRQELDTLIERSKT